jgi:subtilisin family serine protease
LGGGVSAALNAAVASAVAKGLVVVVAAGNNGTDACSASPASEPTAITVGASTSSDTKASYSNYGACVDIFAPGSSITSAWHSSTTASATMSGTSMASPAVVGVAALALQANPVATPAAVAKYLVDKASTNKLSGLDANSPNKLVFSMADGVPGVVPTKTVAVASMRYTTDGPARPIGLWYATIQVAVRDVSTGAPVANAQVAINQLPGGKTTCTTNASGSCAVANFFDTAASITVEGISGSYMVYDASQNLAVQLRLPQPPYAAYAIPTKIKG